MARRGTKKQKEENSQNPQQVLEDSEITQLNEVSFVTDETLDETSLNQMEESNLSQNSLNTEPINELPKEEPQNIQENIPLSEKPLVNVLLEYIQSIFSEERVKAYMDSLSEEQKKYIYAFVDGYKATSKKDVIGVFDINYIASFRFTQELLEKLNINLQVVDVKNLNFKFILIEQ